MVPSIDALAPLPALGVPLDWSTGQAAAHAPAQADWSDWSFSNKYSVRPLPSTRIIPRPVLVAETVATADGAVVGALLPPYSPPPEPDPPELLPHPAASTPTVASATSATSGRRSNPDVMAGVLLVSCPTRMCVPFFAGPGLWCHQDWWSSCRADLAPTIAHRRPDVVVASTQPRPPPAGILTYPPAAIAAGP